MQNIEIKIPIGDRNEMIRRSERAGAEKVGSFQQTDTFFHVTRGYLKLRSVEGRPGELIAYVRESGTQPRASDYVVIQVENASAVREALERGLGMRGAVKKTRTLYSWRHTRIHLDEVAGLGSFLELETVVDGIDRAEAEAESWSLIHALDLDPNRFLARPYLELLEDAATAANEEIPR